MPIKFPDRTQGPPHGTDRRDPIVWTAMPTALNYKRPPPPRQCKIPRILLVPNLIRVSSETGLEGPCFFAPVLPLARNSERGFALRDPAAGAAERGWTPLICRPVAAAAAVLQCAWTPNTQTSALTVITVCMRTYQIEGLRLRRSVMVLKHDI